MNSIRAAGPFGGPCSSNRIQMLRFGAVSNSKSSNGRKIARMARNLTIFGPNRSRRRELKFEKFSNKRANGQTNDLYKNFSKVFRNFRRDPRSLDLNYRFGLANFEISEKIRVSGKWDVSAPGSGTPSNRAQAAPPLVSAP